MKTVFIVDDDEMLSMMLEDHLSAGGRYSIHTFETGEACLQNLHLNPDIVVLDFNLNSVDPNAADGSEILREINRFDKEIYVIMYSSGQDYRAAVESVGGSSVECVLKDLGAFSKIENLIENAH